MLERRLSLSFGSRCCSLLLVLAGGCSNPAIEANSGGNGGNGSGGGADASISGSIDAGFFHPPPIVDAPLEEGGTHFADGGGVLNDASLGDLVAQCVPDGGMAGPGPFARRCAAATENECDGHSDINPMLPNGPNGNGVDDDCDGKVDENCACDAAHPVGTTKACALVSGTQIDPRTQKPVGWCTSNAVGTVSCVAPDRELGRPVWDGECRGAQLPFGDDVCAVGDFDCDGRDANSKTQDCGCKIDVACPTAPILTAPFPDPDNLPGIDGAPWVGMRGPASNWKWTVTGGDCDNILPHPTFAVYGQARARMGGPRLSGNTPQTGLGLNGNQHGFVVGPGANVGPKIYPAFGLSGDYLVKGEWDSPDGHHACTVKVQVRSPGIRVELCWAPMPTDVDLHFARLQNNKKCQHGWFNTCDPGEDSDDCYFGNDCSSGFLTSPSAWGYPRSPDPACHGWSSSRSFDCDNPRLDQDNIECIPGESDPMNTTDFCSPENINLDNPKNGEKFAVGVQYYDGPSNKTPRPHVNVYCNGERKLAFGFDATSMPPNNFPVLRQSGQDLGGDMWEVATIEAKVNPGGMLTDCLISPVHSRTPKPDKDGSKDMCVDTNPLDSATMGDDAWKFTTTGAFPASSDQLCWH
jgi:hypothetical protein